MRTKRGLGFNPVTLKELRQLVRSRLVSTGLIVFLFLQLACVSIALLIARGNATNPAELYGKGIGMAVFGTVTVLLGGVLLLAIPLFISIRMAMEKSAERMDLQFTTTLQPTQFVDGKIVSAITLMLLFASTSLPFLMLAYLLRGVDVFIMLRMLGFLSFLAVCLSYLSLLVGAMNVSKVFRILILVGGSLMLVPFVTGVTSWMMFGVDSFKLRHVLLVLAIAGTGCALVRALAAAILSPPHANSIRPLRQLVVAAWTGWGAAAGITTAVDEEIGWLLAWAIVFAILANFLLMVSVSTVSGCSRRVLAEVSRRGTVRRLQFLLFTGGENGICFSLLLGVLTGGVFLAVLHTAPFVDSDELEMGPFLLSFLCYPAAFLLTVRLFWQAVLHRFMTHRIVGVVALVLIALNSLLPFLLTVTHSSDAFALFWPGNFVAAMDSDSTHGEVAFYHMAVSGLWFLTLLVVFVPGFRKAYGRFRPPEGPGGA